MASSHLNHEILSAAIQGMEERKRKIDLQLAELRAMLTSNRKKSPPSGPENTLKRGRMSAAGRAAIAEAQRRRWAAQKAGTSAVNTPSAARAKKGNRKLSAAGRKAISDAAKRRWAAKRAAAGA